MDAGVGHHLPQVAHSLGCRLAVANQAVRVVVRGIAQADEFAGAKERGVG